MLIRSTRLLHKSGGDTESHSNENITILSFQNLGIPWKLKIPCNVLLYYLKPTHIWLPN